MRNACAGCLLPGLRGLRGSKSDAVHKSHVTCLRTAAECEKHRSCTRKQPAGHSEWAVSAFCVASRELSASPMDRQIDRTPGSHCGHQV